MGLESFSKWGRIEHGMPVTVGPSELHKVRLRHFKKIEEEIGHKVYVESIRPGWYRVGVVS